jgi:hypothetical protein
MISLPWFQSQRAWYVVLQSAEDISHIQWQVVLGKEGIAPHHQPCPKQSRDETHESYEKH